MWTRRFERALPQGDERHGDTQKKLYHLGRSRCRYATWIEVHYHLLMIGDETEHHEQYETSLFILGSLS